MTSDAQSAGSSSLDELLAMASERRASDLLLQEGEPPKLRAAGRIEALGGEDLPAGRVVDLLREVIPPAAATRFEEKGSADFAVERPGERWRVALYQQRGSAAANLRRIPLEVPTLEDWGLPGVLEEILEAPDGLILVTGPAGSGKSSTIASMVRAIVDRRALHVVTIEDPIELILPAGRGVVTQREVGIDVPDFAEGLRGAVRQQADVLVVGEIRDRETAEAALSASETGCLVLSTLHTRSASETVGRLLEMFPEEEKRRVLGQLSRVLRAVASQLLVPRAEGSGLIAAVEVLRDSPPVQQRLAEGDIGGLREEIETSVSYHGMQTMNQSLAALVLLGAVDREEALRLSPSPDDLDLLLRNSELVPDPEDPMADSYADYSQVFQLQELKEAHEQELARNREAESRLERQVEELRAAVEERDAILREQRRVVQELRREYRERRGELQEARKSLEVAVGRLQQQGSRLRERARRSRPWWKRLFGG